DALAPDLQLLDRRGAEGVAGGEHDLVPAVAVLLGELGDGRGLAAAVDTDDENDEGPLREIETQWLHDRLDEPNHLLGEGGANLFGRDLLVEAGLAQRVGDLAGHPDAHVAR